MGDFLSQLVKIFNRLSFLLSSEGGQISSLPLKNQGCFILSLKIWEMGRWGDGEIQ